MTLYYPLVQFVSAPEPNATVRFDFNGHGAWADEDTWPEHDGFSLGVPSFEGDPDGVGAEYGLRELSFNLILAGSKSAATGAMSTLARELMRQSNWLMFQLAPDSAPVWFKTYRSQPGDMSFELVGNDSTGDHWGISVSLFADPFAYGERVTLPTVTINNDPTAATNPMSYTLPTILGDAPSPLRIRAKGSVGTAIQVRTSTTAFLSILGSDKAPTGISVGQSSIISTDTTSNTDTAAIGGTSHSVTFTTATLAVRTQYLFPSLPNGTYKALLRLRAGGSGSFDVRLQNTESTPRDYTKATVTPDAASGYAWADLGRLDVPGGNWMPNDFLPETSRVVLNLAIARLSGTATLYVDELLLVPVAMSDGEAVSGFFTWASSGSTVDAGYIDSDSEAVRLVDSTDTPLSVGNPSTVKGGFPAAMPGVRNVLRYLQSFTPASTYADDITGTTDLTISYQPRYLYLGA